MNTAASPSVQVLPASVRRRLWRIGFAWVLVAALEATAYTVLALAIAHHHGISAVLLAAIVALLVTVLVTRAGFFSGALLAGDLYAALGQALARARLSWFTDAHRAQIGLMAGRSIPGFMSIPAHQLQTFLHAPFMPLFLLPGMVYLAGFVTAAITASLLLLSLWGQYLAQRALARADSGRHAADHAVTQATLELVDHLELLRTAAGPQHALSRLEERWRTQEEALATTNRAAATATFVSTLASVLPLAGIAAWVVWVGQHTPETVLALLVLVARAAAPLGELVVAGLGVNDLRSSLDDYLKIVRAPTLANVPAHNAAQPDNDTLTLRQVCHAPALNDINIVIPQGAKVCVRGASGSVKSTLLGLLMRFDDPQQGEIRLGGVPLQHMRYDALVAHIAYVPQDAVLFTGTLAENIRLGQAHASDEAVERVARQAALGAVLDRSPLGIHQAAGHQGAALSGGERQRVALARALLKQAPILILDEASSALDEATERDIAAVVRALPVTVIFVTHRDPAVWQPTHSLDLDRRADADNVSGPTPATKEFPHHAA